MEEQTMMEQFLSLQVMMQRYFMSRRKTNGPFGNPHRGQGRVLKLLQLKPSTTQKELSYLLDMRPQSLGELLGKLEKNGYITREPLESDRRVMRITLTEAGKVAAENNEQEDEPIFSTLSDEEKESLKKIMTKLIGAIEAEIPEDERAFKKMHKHGHRQHGFGGRYDRMDDLMNSRKKIHEHFYSNRYSFDFRGNNF